MKDWDNSYLLQLIAEGATTFWSVDLEITDTLTQRFTTMDIDIAHGGNLYKASEFMVTPVNYNLSMAVDKWRLDFGNVDLAFSATLLNNNVSMRPASIYAGAMDGMIPVAVPVFQGLIGAWDIDEKKAEIEIVDELVFWNKTTLRKPGDKCPWPFKGAECGYAGAETTCNKIYSQCRLVDSLEDTDNSFGGFRFFPAIEEKEVYWGRTSK